MRSEVIGRTHELGVVEAFVARVQAEPASLAFEGEAGSGKTTLWLAACELARSAGARVLSARPLEAETGFAYAGIADLLADATEPIAELPEPQARALRVALLLEPSGEVSADERAVGLGLLGVLCRLATQQPVVLAVDDLQWLDAPSARALGFAARRLDDEPVGVLVTIRDGPRSRLALEPVRAFPALDRVRVEALPLEDVHRLVRSRLGITLSRPVLREVHRASAGNPLFALELARAVVRGEGPGSPGRLGVPRSLGELVGARIAALPAGTRRALAVAAALADPAVEIVSEAIGADAVARLDPAVAGEVVELDGRHVHFTHPLLAAAAYEQARPRGRQEIHGTLATLVGDPEERARHLALAASGPDAVVAAALDEAARSALARGAPVVAGELAELAARLTPVDETVDARRRRLDGAYWLFEAGDAWRARAMLEEVIGETEPGGERARALVLLASIRSYDDDLAAAREILLAAIDEAGVDVEARLAAHEGVATTSFRLRDRLDEGVEHAAEAARLARSIGRDDLLGESLASQALTEAIVGRMSARATIDAALALQPASEHTRITRQPEFPAAVIELWHDDLAGAAARLELLAERAAAIGDESSIPYVNVILGQLECVRGRYEEALRLTEGQLEHARQAGQETLVAYLLGVAAWAHAYTGDDERARRAARESLRLAKQTSGVPAWFFATSALGQLELAAGRPAEAIAVLEPLASFVREQGMAEPGALWFVGDAIEALIELDRPAEATSLLDWYELHADRLGRLSAQAVAHRCRGLQAAASGEPGRAIASFEKSLELLERCPRALEKGRALLGLGSARRRLKERRAGREALESARSSFQQIGARLWVERAEAELARIGGRAPSTGALTPVEQRVVELVASGKSNKEAAAALFLSTRTVEGHLSRAYGKLGVRSRVELARRLDEPGIPDSKVE